MADTFYIESETGRRISDLSTVDPNKFYIESGTGKQIQGSSVAPTTSPFIGTQQITGDNPGTLSYGATDPTTGTRYEEFVPDRSISTSTLQTQTPLQIQPTDQPNYDADVLAAGATDTSKQLTSLDSKIAGEEGKVDTLSSQLSSLLESSGGQGQATLDAENAAGIPQMQQQLQTVNSQIQTKLAEFNKIQSQYGELMQANEMKTIPMDLIRGKNAEVQRSLALQKNTFAAEIGLLQATAQGLQGQIELARQTADRAVDLKYQDIYRQIEIKQSQLDLVRDLLTTDEKKKAAILDQQYQLQRDTLDAQVADEKQTKTYLLNLMADNPSAGITLTDTPEQAVAKVAATGGTTSSNLMEISAGASLYDPATGQFVATAPKTTTSGGTTTFTQTQTNKGASNAGMTIEEFGTLSDDSKNYYVNSYSQFQSILNNVASGAEDAQSVIDEINSSNIPDDVKENLVNKLEPYIKTKSDFTWWNPLTWF